MGASAGRRCAVGTASSVDGALGAVHFNKTMTSPFLQLPPERHSVLKTDAFETKAPSHRRLTSKNFWCLLRLHKP